MKLRLHLTFIVSIFASLSPPTALSNDNETPSFNYTYYRDFTSQYRFYWTGKKPDRWDTQPGVELCEKALKNETLRRYLSVADKWEEVLGQELMPLEYVKFEGERFFPRKTLKISDDLINAYWMGDKFLRDVVKHGNKILKGLRSDEEKWERYTFPVFVCGAILRGTDEFRLFTESGREISYQRGGCRNEKSPFCKGKLGTYTKEKFNALTGEIETETYWDKNANPLRVDFWYRPDLGTEFPIRHHNGFLLFLLMFPQGEKALENMEKVLDAWELSIEKVLRIRSEKEQEKLRLQIAELERTKDKNEDKVTVSTQETVEDTPPPPPNETIYANVYRNFLRVKFCYESREGYMSVLVNSVQWSKAKKEYNRRKKLLDLPIETVTSIEKSIDQIFYPDKSQPKQPYSIVDDLDATWADLARKGTLPIERRTKYFCDASISNLYDGEDNFPYPFGM